METNIQTENTSSRDAELRQHLTELGAVNVGVKALGEFVYRLKKP